MSDNSSGTTRKTEKKQRMLTNAQIFQFFEQLRTLIAAGITPHAALEIMQNDGSNAKILPLLTPEELALYKRGRNAHVHSVPHNAAVKDYHAATGLEALFGWLYVVAMRANVSNVLKSKPFQKKKSQQSSRGGRPMSDEEYNRRRAADQKRVDAILDKISRSGYDTLSKEEKEFLFKFKA